jgi:hypothetical protein
MSTELIVLRAFLGNRAVAEEMVARGFGVELVPTREGREVAQVLLDMRGNGSSDLEALKTVLSTRGRVPARLRKYLGELERTPRYPQFDAVAHFLLLKLDWAMDRVDRAFERVGAEVPQPPKPAAAPPQGARSGEQEREYGPARR